MAAGPAPDADAGVTVLVGGVGELYQGDLDVGRRAAERLAGAGLGPGVLVEELHYGAVAVAQRLEELRPHTLVLVGAAARGRAPGTVERRRLRHVDLDPADVQAAVHDAVTGYVAIDLVVEVGWGLRALPPRTVTVEVEPAPVDGPSEHLSAPARAGLVRACDLVRVEARRAALFEVADELRRRLAEEPPVGGPLTGAMQGLLGELEVLDAEGRWGETFRHRDTVHSAMTRGDTPDDMRNVDWTLWWALLDELGRVGAAEALGT